MENLPEEGWHRGCNEGYKLINFDVDAQKPGQFLHFPTEYRLPDTTGFINILLRHRPGVPSSRYPAWKRFLDADIDYPEKDTTLSLDLIRPEDESFSRNILCK